MRRQVLITALVIAVASGCAPILRKKKLLSQARQIKTATLAQPVDQFIKTVLAPEQKSPLETPEKLIYKAKFLGFSIGEFIVVNKGKTQLNGRSVYCFELIVHTLPFFGVVKDRYVSYMDADKLVVVRHEEYLKKGDRLESVVDFDYARRTAFYKNVMTGQERQVAIPGAIHDIVTGGYTLRTLPREVGDTVELNIYADEKIYNYVGVLHSKTAVNMPRRPKQEAYLLKSYLFYQGKPVKGITAEVFLSTDKTYRQPLRAVLKTFLGSVGVTVQSN